jgi:integrase
VFDHLERVIPKGTKLSLLTPGTFAFLQRDLRQRGLRDITIATTLRTLKGILNWAVRREMLPKVPLIDMPRQPRGRRFMRGRPLTVAEFDAMMEAVPKVVSCDVAAWRHYLTGLWFSGLRVGESQILSWDPDEVFVVDLAGRHPRFRICAEAHKSYRDEKFPMTPDFAAFLFETPEQDRRGRVFTLLHPRWRTPIKGRESVGKIVAKIGRAAGVVTDRRRGKYATAHDLRRSFGTRWAPRIMPAVLQRLMRHSSIVTTLTYYVDLDADGLADGLWRDFGPAQARALAALPQPAAFTEAIGANAT